MESKTREESKKLCDDIFSGLYTDNEIAEILILLSDKGETPHEIAGFSDSLLSHASPFPNRTEVFDLCGTGGSSLDRFNVSTAVAFVVASLGINVAKHGNRGSRRPNGSFDLLEYLGINIELGGDILSEILDETNLAFIYARQFHGAMKAVAKARKMASRRTIFNLAGPISNPAHVTKQIIGTIDESAVDTLAEVLKTLNRKRGIVVTGYPGIDELSVSGDSTIFDIGSEKSRIKTEDFNFSPIEYNQIPCGISDTNAKEFHKLIEGQGHPGIVGMVNANAALSLMCVGAASDMYEGYKMSEEVLMKGKVKELFERYKQLSNRYDN